MHSFFLAKRIERKSGCEGSRQRMLSVSVFAYEKLRSTSIKGQGSMVRCKHLFFKEKSNKRGRLAEHVQSDALKMR